MDACRARVCSSSCPRVGAHGRMDARTASTGAGTENEHEVHRNNACLGLALVTCWSLLQARVGQVADPHLPPAAHDMGGAESDFEQQENVTSMLDFSQRNWGSIRKPRPNSRTPGYSTPTSKGEDHHLLLRCQGCPCLAVSVLRHTTVAEGQGATILVLRHVRQSRSHQGHPCKLAGVVGTST